jgi:hypothetical protein
MSGQDTGWASGFTGPLLTATAPGRKRDDREPARSCFLPAERMVTRGTVLIAEHGYLTAILTMPLRTLVTQPGHARNNLMSVSDWPGRRTAARLAAAPDTGPAARRVLLAAAAGPGDRGHARVRIAGGAR